MSTVVWVLALLAGLILSSAAPASAAFEVDVSKAPRVRDGEPSLGVNPRDPTNLVTAYMKSTVGECAVSASFDRGRTWRSQVLDRLTTPLYSFCADPTLVFGGDGTVYVAAIAFNQTFLIGHTMVTSSDDGGRHWSRPVEAVGGSTPPYDGFDRPWLAFDDESGTLYLTTMRIFTRPYGPLAHRYLLASDDGGRHWTRARTVDTPEYPADHWTTGTIAVAPNGEVAVAYVARQVPEPGMLCPCAVLATTRNGADFHHRTVPFTDAMLGAASIPERGPLSVLRLVYGPVVAADPTDAGRYAVAVTGWDGLVTFLIGQSGPGPRETVRTQVFLTRNSGRSWAGPTLLGRDPLMDHEHVWVDYSPRGVLGATWRTHSGACCFGRTTVWTAVSPSGGPAFRPARRLSRAPSPFTGGLGDDFQSVVVDNSFLHAAWGDGRTGDEDVYYGRAPLP